MATTTTPIPKRKAKRYSTVASEFRDWLIRNHGASHELQVMAFDGIADQEWKREQMEKKRNA